IHTFGDLIVATSSPIDTTPASTLETLRPASAKTQVAFRFTCDLLLTASAVVWWRVLRARRRHGLKLGTSVLFGLGIMLATVGFIAAPYRIVFHNEMPRVEFGGQRCYVIGEADARTLLFCPDVAPPRNRVVASNDARIHRSDRTESIFTPR